MVWILRLNICVQLITDDSATELLANLRHEFAIGPLRYHPLFDGKARQYYCTRCEWTLLVSGARVGLLGEHSQLLAVDADLRSELAPEIDSCPVLEAIASEMFGAVNSFQAKQSGNNQNETRHLAFNDVRSRSGDVKALANMFINLGKSLARLVRLN